MYCSNSVVRLRLCFWNVKREDRNSLLLTLLKGWSRYKTINLQKVCFRCLNYLAYLSAKVRSLRFSNDNFDNLFSLASLNTKVSVICWCNCNPRPLHFPSERSGATGPTREVVPQHEIHCSLLIYSHPGCRGARGRLFYNLQPEQKWGGWINTF